VQALADISRSALYAFAVYKAISVLTSRPMLSQQRNPCKSAHNEQLQGTPYNSFKLHPGPCSNAGMRWGTDRQTHRWPWPIHISPRLHV